LIKRLVDLLDLTRLAANQAEHEAGTADDAGSETRFSLQRAKSAQRRFLQASKTLATL